MEYDYGFRDEMEKEKKEGNRKKWFYLLMFGLFIVLMAGYSFFTLRTGIHDAGEYITLAKELAGVGNVAVFSAHPVIYSAFLGFFFKYYASFATIKLINAFFLIAIGFVLYKLFNNKKAFLLWMFSPLIWIVGIEVSPILPVALFVLLGYYFYNLWEEKGSVSSLIISGFCWWFTFSLWTATIFLVGMFMLIFFWKKRFDEVVLFSIGGAVALLIGFWSDYLVFGFPFHSIIRYFGVNLVILAGMGNNHLIPITWELLFRVLFCIVPLSFFLIFLDFKKYKKEALFVLICTLFFFFRGGQKNAIKVFLTFAPMWIILVSKVLNWKKILLNCLISIGLIALIIYPYFTDYHQQDFYNDVETFKTEFSFDEVLTGEDQALNFASASWSTKPYFLWWNDYEMSLNGEKDYSRYSYYVNNQKINQNKILYMQFGLERSNDRSFEGVALVTTDRNENYEGFEKIKSYKTFDVYVPVNATI